MRKATPYTNLCFFGIITLFALMVRMILAYQDINVLDRSFLPDDTFYTLSIARSIAMGLGPSADGIHITNGFQPLIAFLQVPIFYLGYGGDEALRFAVYLSAFFGAISVLPLGFLLFRIANINTAIIACIMWAVSPFLIANDLNALETSLAGFFSLLTIFLTIIADGDKKVWQWLTLGLCCGLSFLARIDNCFLLATIGFFAFRRWGILATLIITSKALIVVAPWWIYSFDHFGTIIPRSGEAVKFIIDNNQAEWIPIILSGLYALASWLPLLEYFTGMMIPEIWISTLLITVLFFYGFKQIRPYGKLFVIPSLLSIVFYFFYLPAFWFFHRYFYFVHISILVLLALFLGQKRSEKDMKTAKWVSGVIILFYCLDTSIFLFKRPVRSGINGYRNIALSIKSQLQPGDTLGAMQSGALGYYLFPRNKVINIDGVVIGKVLDALKNNQLREYVNKEKMTHYADWRLNIKLFKQYYGRPLPKSCFYPIYAAPSTTNDRPFYLYRYHSECS